MTQRSSATGGLGGTVRGLGSKAASAFLNEARYHHHARATLFSCLLRAQVEVIKGVLQIAEIQLKNLAPETLETLNKKR